MGSINLDEFNKQLIKQVSKIEMGTFEFEVGVFEFTKKDDRKSDDDNDQPTNSQILFYNEYGTAKIPARPILQYTVDWANHTLKDKIAYRIANGVLNDDWSEQEIIQNLKGEAMQIADHTRVLAQDLKPFTPNAKSTIEKKSKKNKQGKITKLSDVPLVDTGQLIRSITCKVKKIG